MKSLSQEWEFTFFHVESVWYNAFVSGSSLSSWIFFSASGKMNRPVILLVIAVAIAVCAEPSEGKTWYFNSVNCHYITFQTFWFFSYKSPIIQNPCKLLISLFSISKSKRLDN